MTKKEKLFFGNLFSNPLEVVNTQDRLQGLDWDESEYPLMSNNDGVPIAVLKLSNGNGAKIRFDKKPPRLSGSDFKPNRFLIDESDFIALVGATRAGKSVESYLFSELFKYPVKAAHHETEEEIHIIVESFSVHDVGGIPIALMSRGDNGWIPISFDCDPPRFCRIDVNDGKPLDKAEFV